MTKIFISHSSKDKEFALQLSQALTEIGIDVWNMESDIRAGKKWSTAIQEGLDICEVMIVVISPEAMASVNVEDEWQYFFDEHKPVIPILWRPPEKIHFQLRRIQYIKFHEQEFATAFDLLRAELQRQGFSGSAVPGQIHEDRSVMEAKSVNLQIETGVQTLVHVEKILPQPFEWRDIPNGQVILKAGGYLDIDTVFDVPVFKIAKFPITNGQFAKFVDNGGYSERLWWTEAGWQWKEQDQWIEPGFWREKHRKTREYPVVGVSWYEAEAFCRWLSEASGASIRLPTEQEWERAAEGDTERAYPWGSGFVKEWCNTRESGIGHTTPVTQYPPGASPYGVMDMYGNVWEWCLNNWETGDTHIRSTAGLRSIRGSAWNDNGDNTPLFFRGRRKPENRVDNQGFRIVLNP